MENLILTRYIRMFDALSMDLKKELLERLTDNFNRSTKKYRPDKKRLLDELFGAWNDVDDNMVEHIYKSRTTSDKNLLFD